MKVGLLTALFLISLNSFGATAQCDKSPLPDVRATTYYIADEEKHLVEGDTLEDITMVMKELKF